jgi:hypothetical protein
MSKETHAKRTRENQGRWQKAVKKRRKPLPLPAATVYLVAHD